MLKKYRRYAGERSACMCVVVLMVIFILSACASERSASPQKAPQDAKTAITAKAKQLEEYQKHQQQQLQQQQQQHQRQAQSRSRPSAATGKADPAQPSRPMALSAMKQPVKAIYVTAHVANGTRLNELIRLVKETELNAMVLDINSGVNLAMPTVAGAGHQQNYAKLAPSNKKAAEHFRQVIKRLKKENIYLIARIVTFKNPGLANSVPAWALKNKNGGIWRDRSGAAWIDPFKQEAWEYPIALAEHAVQLGFDEIQYDYVRFPENAAKVDREVTYANKLGWSKSETIRHFLHHANERIHKHGARVSADVFGMVTSSDDDMGIGQRWADVAREVDVIAPMVYPSHYAKGTWGIANPDLSPGAIVTRALKDSAKRNRKLNEQGIATAKVRPWLQGFTASWIHPHQKYGDEQIREQIVAARNAGFQSYMIWNSANRYPRYTT